MNGVLQSDLLPRAASALRHFVWQGAVIGAVFAAADALLRRAAPRARYTAACAALALMLAAPAVTFVRISPSDPAHDRASHPEVTPADASTLAAAAADAARPAPSARLASDRVAPWIVGAWLAGVAGLSVRLVAACVAVDRLRRRRSRPAPAALAARLAGIAARMRVSRPVRLLECATIRVPGAVGALRPAVLLPAGIASGLTAGQLDALLAHELAHVARRDYLVHLLQTLAETLLFFHPAVWWVSHRIRVEREHACDDLAAAATGDAIGYARALLALEETRLATPALVLAATGGGLSARIRRLVAGETAATSPWIAGALALSSAVAVGAAARVPPSSVVQQPPEAVPVVPAKSVTPVSAQDTSAATKGAAGTAGATPAKPAKNEAPPPLSADDLIAFRIHGVTPEFIAAIRAEGYPHPTPDELVALRIHGATPDYVHRMNESLGRQPLEDLAALRIHGLTPETVAELKATFGQLSADDALALRIHGATPEFAREMRAAGFPKLTADDAVAFRIHGVTPEAVRDLRSMGLPELSADDAVAFRIHGVTPEFVRELRGVGLEDLAADDLVAFRIHGVTPEFVKEIHGLGYASISADDLVAFRIHGVTPERIRDANARAGRRLSADDLIDRRLFGDEDEEEETR